MRPGVVAGDEFVNRAGGSADGLRPLRRDHALSDAEAQVRNPRIDWISRSRRSGLMKVGEPLGTAPA